MAPISPFNPSGCASALSALVGLYSNDCSKHIYHYALKAL